MTISSFFDNVPAGPPDPMFDLQIRLNNDRYPGKIDLGAGVYRDERGAYFELPAIKLVRLFPTTRTANEIPDGFVGKTYS